MIRLGGAVAAMLAATLWPPAMLAQGHPETFTGMAAVKHGGASASAPFTVTITRYSSDAEREAVIAAVRSGGSAAVSRVLASMPDAGFLQLAERRTAIKFAGQRATGPGRLVTVVSAKPIWFLGAGAAEAPPRAGYDVGVAMLDLVEGSAGTGELVPAAKIGVDPKGSLLIEDYGATVVWLNGLTRGS